jgi:diguanylate cyclase (GGDEF)-like protein
VSAATHHRRALVVSALALFGVVFTCFFLFETPGLGLGHFFYIPVVLVALALGLRGGIAGAAVAASLYALAIVVTPRVPARDVLTYATGIRFVTYTTVGLVIGWYADQHRAHIAQLRELADRDFLTGLLNTRVFDEAFARRCAAEAPFALVLADMDDLKHVNDAHGHAEGNRAIRLVGETLARHVPAGADVARVGGDEFALLLEGSLETAQTVCERLKRSLSRTGLDVSFGWAARPEDGESSLELFRKADDRLYAAKLIGRNRRTVTALTAAANRRAAS